MTTLKQRLEAKAARDAAKYDKPRGYWIEATPAYKAGHESLHDLVIKMEEALRKIEHATEGCANDDHPCCGSMAEEGLDALEEYLGDGG